MHVADICREQKQMLYWGGEWDRNYRAQLRPQNGNLLLLIRFVTTVPTILFKFWFEKQFVKPPLERNNEHYGRCGPLYNFSSCPPNSNDWNEHCHGPCCSPNGYCGWTSDHCACENCFDFRREEMEESDICCKVVEISWKGFLTNKNSRKFEKNRIS